MEEYLTTQELSRRIKFTPGTIRNMVCRRELKQGIHYVKAGPRRLLFLWSGIENWLHKQEGANQLPPQLKSLINI